MDSRFAPVGGIARCHLGHRHPPRVEEGFSDGKNGEDEFDSVVGLLAMIGVVTGTIPTGEPQDHLAISTTEGWILGRSI
jgi:hypothetical protein